MGKKLITLLIIAILLFQVTGCGGGASAYKSAAKGWVKELEFINNKYKPLLKRAYENHTIITSGSFFVDLTNYKKVADQLQEQIDAIEKYKANNDVPSKYKTAQEKFDLMIAEYKVIISNVDELGVLRQQMEDEMHDKQTQKLFDQVSVKDADSAIAMTTLIYESMLRAIDYLAEADKGLA